MLFTLPPYTEENLIKASKWIDFQCDLFLKQTLEQRAAPSAIPYILMGHFSASPTDTPPNICSCLKSLQSFDFWFEIFLQALTQFSNLTTSVHFHY